MWKASRWALFGPIPGSRPSSSIRSWTGPSYMLALRSEGQAAAAEPTGQRAELAGGDGLGLVVGVAYRGHDQVGQGLGVLGINGFGLDRQTDQLAGAGDRRGDQVPTGGALDLRLGQLLLGVAAAAPASPGPGPAVRTCRLRESSRPFGVEVLARPAYAP